MALIKGIPVVLIIKRQVKTDPLGAPVYEYEEETVENVLVSPATSDDLITSQDLYGKKAVYTLAIPKGDTHNWEDCKVRFFNQEWQTFGIPLEGIEENIPLDWNKKVMVKRYG